MPAKRGQEYRQSESEILRRLAIWRENDRNMTRSAEIIGIDRNTLRSTLYNAMAAGLLDEAELHAPNLPAVFADASEFERARMEMLFRRDRKVRKGDWRKPTMIMSVPEGPIILGILGDPHADNPGTDFDALERDMRRANPAERVFTSCIGDVFDNWPRAMGHLYQGTGDPAPAFTFMSHLLKEHPFLWAVSGNHDEFSNGTVNFMDGWMRGAGVHYRRSGGRFLLPLGGEPITVSARHIWRGRSMYSEAHALKRAVRDGFTADDLVVGGHTHQGEIRAHVRPLDGKVSKLVQVSAYKEFDDYANDKGFMSSPTQPCVWCVLNPAAPVESHERVLPFYSYDTARGVLDGLL